MTGKVVSKTYIEPLISAIGWNEEVELVGIYIIDTPDKDPTIWFRNEKDLKEYAEWKGIKLV